MDRVEQRGPGSITVSLDDARDRRSVQNAWALRVRGALETALQGRAPVRWWTDGPTVWVDVGPEGRLLGRVRLSWSAAGNRLDIESTTDGVEVDSPPLSKFFDVLVIVAGVAGLVAWVALLVWDWDRVWNRLSSSSSAERASKLELFLLAIGWFLGPVLLILPVTSLADAIMDRFRRGAAARNVDFSRRELDPVVTAAVNAACTEATSNAATRVALALGSSS
jgi:hypothetical protein